MLEGRRRPTISSARSGDFFDLALYRAAPGLGITIPDLLTEPCFLNFYRKWDDDAAWLAIVHVSSHSRHRHTVVTVNALASVSMILPWQKGHLVGRVTSPSRRGSNIALLPESSRRATSVARVRSE
jgi:hypothetical protein